MRGGMEAVYDDMVQDTGFLCFAPSQAARGPMFSARTRLKVKGESSVPAPISEDQLYGD
jgi:hypothetical protein